MIFWIIFCGIKYQLRFEVLMAVNIMIAVVWWLCTNGLEEHTASPCYSEVGHGRFLRNTGTFLPYCIPSRSKRL
jgi:hypothetical protein